MNDYRNPERPNDRLSHAEREGAVSALAHARDEGRLQPTEYAERAERAGAAVTWSDLTPLFGDLPASMPAARPGVGAGSPVAGPDTGFSDSAPVRRALGGTTGTTIMALVPFIALALFFLTGWLGGFTWAWLWFGLIPIAGIVIYAGDDVRHDRWRTVLISLTPFVALGLFFATGFNGSFAYSWLWFLLVPVMGILLYGPNGGSRRRR